MGLVIQKANGREYVSIRESYWDPVKRKYTSRTIKNYGRLDLLLEKDPEILDKIRDQAESLKSDRKEVRKSELYHRARAELARPEGGRDFADARRILIGSCIWRRIWDKLDLSGKLRQFSEDGKCAFDFSDAVFFMTAAECLMPNTEPNAEVLFRTGKTISSRRTFAGPLICWPSAETISCGTSTVGSDANIRAMPSKRSAA